jgi:iron complex outermembrane recepter protein
MLNESKLKTKLLCATIFTGFMLSTPAQAQEEPEDGTEADAGDVIIVTGTRRSTAITEVPINITAIGAEDIERQRLDDVRDLADFTPGLTVADTGPRSTGSIVLRGLNASDVGDGANFDNALGVYLGEVPLYYDFKLLDVERVETLLGPQGTLYGLGTLAGAIRYIPKRPNTEDVEGEAHGRLYAKNEASKIGYQADGVINIPIIKGSIGFRSATGYYYDPEFIDYNLLVQTPGVSLPQPSGPVSITPAAYAANLTARKDLNFEKTFTSRNQLMFQDGEYLKLIFTYAFQRTKSDGAQQNGAGVLGTGRYESSDRFIEPINRRAHLASMEINANIEDVVDLVATTAYTDVKVLQQNDNTDLLLDLDYDYELFPAFTSFNKSNDRRTQINQEIRLVSRHGGPFQWVLGGFYNEQTRENEYTEFVPGLTGFYGITGNPDEIEYASYIDSTITEKAIFGEGKFDITPEWQVTGGARYFKYTSRIQGALVLPLLGDPLSPFEATPAGGNAAQDGWVWKLNSSYKITPDIMVYGTYSKGYRLGGPNRVAPCPNPVPVNQQNACALPNEIQFGPDTTKNVELGIRASLFDRLLTLSLNAFDVRWKGIQVESATFYGATGIIVNGGSAKSRGIDTSFQIKPIPELVIQGTYSYNDAELTEDVPGILAIRRVLNDYDARPKFIQLPALSGDRLPGSSKNSGSLAATYTTPIMDGELIANWTATYRGSIVTRLGWERAFGDKLPSYVLHRAGLTYDTDNYSISLFANNIFNKYAVTSVSNDRSRIGVNDGVAVRYYKQSVLNPRVFGIEARYKF